jgi:phosphoglycerate dehydrogenase-like enzyme
MVSLIAIHAGFESHWPFVAGHFLSLWQQQEETHLVRLAQADQRCLGELYPQPGQITRLACLGVPVTLDCLQRFTALREATFPATYGPSQLSEEGQAYLQKKEVSLYDHPSEGFWGQSVAEFALALTICGLRHIPQSAHEMITSHEPWERYKAAKNQGPGQNGAQSSDDLRFTHGTVAGKRVRIVGAGNIGSRYASFMHMLGADVAVWDPFATEPAFHRAGSRRQWRLAELVKDAEIFAPMLPLTAQTRNLVTAAHINTLPQGCLVVLVTRAAICDMAAVRRRVLAGELSLAADVFDVEPLPLDDPLLGRSNVVHTPHLAGRTADANRQWVEALANQFQPLGG